MTTGIATSLANAILDSALRGQAFTPPGGVWVKLHRGDPGAAGTSNPAANTTRSQATLSAASGGATTNSADIFWTNVPNSETVTHVSFWDASSGGTFLGSDALDSSVAFLAGESGVIYAGALDFALSPVAA